MSRVLTILKQAEQNRAVVGIPNRSLNEPVVPTKYQEPVGIEIEIEGTNLPTAGYLDHIVSTCGTSWLVKQDGSLRGGLEYVLSKPCAAEQIPYLINGLYDAFAQRNSNLVGSNRCSIHVHYNVGGLKVNEVTSIIALWTVFEEPLLRWWGDARYRNHFCLSSKDEDANVTAWQNFLRTGELPADNTLRYTALNLVAINKYGSLEFRGGGAVTEPHKATLWPTFLYRLCHYAKENYKNPHQLAYDLSERSPLGIFEDICGEEFQEFCEEVVGTVPDFNRCCVDSFHNVQPFIFGFPWHEWMDLINRTYVPNPFSSGSKKKKSPRLLEINAAQWDEIRPAPRVIDADEARNIFNQFRQRDQELEI